MVELHVTLSFEWEAVLRDEDEEYLFPQPITRLMRQTHGGPAVYRWNVYYSRPEDRRLVYIGETAKLAPDRIRGYLKPGPSQKTNRRLRSSFDKYTAQGLKVGLEVLRVEEVGVDDFAFAPNDLHDKHVRQFIEGLVITYYKRAGFTILNL